ncbi:MAG: protein-glutamine gamma-glutamyltransferase [Oscillospiraceae bacterium]|jgi:protein-glutamine gamma-glutamyltransferase|nr:protein-glutamine gamma-glutamyltransferase [Oscillospiraceae bacterium]
MANTNFESQMRAAIVEQAQRLYRSGLNFATFRKSFCNSLYWFRTPDGGFSLRSDKKAADAIADIYRNGGQYGTECATAMIIIYLGALLAVTGGSARFNSMFSGVQLMNWHKLPRALAETGRMNTYSSYYPGDRRYFKNPDVDLAHPEWQGENVIDLGGGEYYGHGIGIMSAEQIISDLNTARRSGSSRTSYLMNSAGRPNFGMLVGAF